MLSKFAIPVTLAWLSSTTVYASTGLDATFTRSLQDCARIVDSLRLEKEGQLRVFAADGTEFTSGQTRWMQAQLRRIDAARARGDQAEAARRLAEVQELIKQHSRA